MRSLLFIVLLTGLSLGQGGSKPAFGKTDARVSLASASASDLKALRKRPLERPRLVHFWATWCVPCLEEFHLLVSLHSRCSAVGFELVTVSLDQPEDREKVFAFLSSQGASGRNFLFDGKNLFGMLKAFDRKWNQLLPYTVLIDTHGEIIYRKEGKVDMQELAEVVGGERGTTLER